MIVKETIQKLQEFPEDLEVTISDGYEMHFYHTKGAQMNLFDDGDIAVVDIGIGGCSL